MNDVDLDESFAIEFSTPGDWTLEQEEQWHADRIAWAKAEMQRLQRCIELNICVYPDCSNAHIHDTEDFTATGMCENCWAKASKKDRPIRNTGPRRHDPNLLPERICGCNQLNGLRPLRWLRVLRDAPLNLKDNVIRSTLWAIATYASGQTGGHAYPGVAQLVAKLGISDSTVRRHINRGVDYGFLYQTGEHKRRSDGKPGLNNEYQLCAPMAWLLAADQIHSNNCSNSPVTDER